MNSPVCESSAFGAQNASFKALRQFNDPDLAHLAGLRVRTYESFRRCFDDHRYVDKVALALVDARVMSMKELVESFEFYARVRRRVRAPVVVDLCAGHGLVGLLFGCFERSVERVVLVDKVFPSCAHSVLDAISSVAPWVRGKVEYQERRVESIRSGEFSSDTSFTAVHACGGRTDRCLAVAVAERSPIAVMPCCYARTARKAPRAFRKVLGAALTTDIHRTYTLEESGYSVEWAAVPAVITPMNRIIVALP